MTNETLRDKIAEAIYTHTHSMGEVNGIEDAADAILAEIIASVPQLVWDKHPDDCEWYAVTSDSNYGPEMGYTLTKNAKGRFIVRMRSGGEKLGKFDTLEAAQAAAQAHHVAQMTG